MTLYPERYTIRIYIKEPAMNARLPTSALPPIAQKDSTVFTSGNSQAVRIPKEFQLTTKHVRVIRRGDELIIKPKYLTAAEILANMPPLDPNEQDDWEGFVQVVNELRKEPAQERDWDALFGKSASTQKAAPKRAPRNKK
jgi:antitoxin VapB